MWSPSIHLFSYLQHEGGAGNHGEESGDDGSVSGFRRIGFVHEREHAFLQT